MQNLNLITPEIWLPRRTVLVPGSNNLKLLDDQILHTDGHVVKGFEQHIKGEHITVASAYVLAAFAHHGQVRANGESYLNHLLGVYNILKHDFASDVPTRAAGLLHDIIEDTDVTLTDLLFCMNYEPTFQVDGMTKPPKASLFEEGHSRYFEKFCNYARKDPRLVFVRLADRLDNLRTLYCFRTEKRERIADETERLYLPLSIGKPIHDEFAYLTQMHLRH